MLDWAEIIAPLCASLLQLAQQAPCVAEQSLPHTAVPPLHPPFSDKKFLK
eukprot:SAG31_NODE_33865_length_339_cov_0.850000_1_plen_49_part_10